MYHRGNRESEGFSPLPPLYEPSKGQGSVFPGKPHIQQNLAMQRSIMDIFEDFTEIISGELRTLNEQEFEREAKRPPQ